MSDWQTTEFRSAPTPGDQLGRYRLERELGRGGMGIVFLALDTHLDRRVALKVIAPEISNDPSFSARFAREMRIAAQLEHPNVVPVYEAGELDGLLFISMRYIEGQDLRARLYQVGQLDPQTLESLAVQLGAALDAAHERGLVHRDVKPANILLGVGARAEYLYLSDFGLAREAVSDSGLTNTGQWMGTIDYVAPEQLEAGVISARTDIYSMGCVLFELLTGSVPFSGPVARKLFAHANLPVPSVGEAGGAYEAQIDGVLARATAKDPAQRYPSAGDLGRAFADALAGRALSGAERSVARGAALTGIPSVAGPTGAGPPFIRTPAHAQTVRELPPPPVPLHARGDEAPTQPIRERRRLTPLLLVIAGVLIAAAAAAAAVVLSRNSASTTGSRNPLARVAIQVATPTNDSVVNSASVPVRGTVDPPTATVDVQGRQAQVTGGVFAAMATVGSGKNTIDIEASAQNATPASTSIVVTGQQPGGVPQGNTGPGTGSTSGGESASSGTEGLPNESTAQMAQDITPVLVQFYQDQIDGQYQSMIGLTSPRYQSAVIDPNPSQWVQNQSSGTRFFSGAQNISVSVTAQDQGDSSVTIDVSGLGFNEPGSSCTMWQGLTWAQYVDGGWRYDPSPDVTSSRQAFAQANQSQLIGAGCLH